jgi:hypothetical protein
MADVRLTDDDLRALANGAEGLYLGAICEELLAARAREARVRAVDGQEFGDALSEGRGRTMYLCGVSDVKAAIRAALGGKGEVNDEQH